MAKSSPRFHPYKALVVHKDELKEPRNISSMIEMPGATLREVYAGMAMQGILASLAADGCIDPVDFKRKDIIAQASVSYADELIAALEK